MFRNAYITLLFLYFCNQAMAQATYQWNAKFGGNGIDIVNKTCVDADGNLYIVGTFEDTVDFNPSIFVTNNMIAVGAADVFIVKLNSNGGFIWAKQLSSLKAKSVSSVCTDLNNNVYIVGSFRDSIDVDPSNAVINLYANGNEDIYIVKLNSNGNFNWAKSIGGTGNDKANDIRIDMYGNVYTVGYYTSSVQIDFDPNTTTNYLPSTTLSAGFLLKLDNSGNFVWAKAYNTRDTKLKQLEVANDIIYFIAEYANTTPTSYVNAVDATTGNNVWRKEFTPNIGGKTYISSLDLSPNKENLYIGCTFSGTADFNPNAGIAFTLTSNGDKDICIVKIDTDGNLIWAKQIGGTTGEEITDIAIDPCDFVHFTGFFTGTVDFNPNAGIANLTADIIDIYMATLDINGNYKNAYKLSGILGINFGNTITSIKNNFYLGGLFTGILNFDNNNPNNIFAAQTSSGLISGYSAKYRYLSKIDYTDTVLVCKGSSYKFPDGIIRVINSEGTFTSSISRVNECDSTIKTFVKIKQTSSSNQSINTCDSFIINNKIYYNSDIIIDTLINSVGCDSIVSINLNIRNKSIYNNTQRICERDTIYVLNKKYYETGIYYDTANNSLSCDSIIVTNLEVIPNSFFEDNQTICLGASYTLPNGSIVQQAGTYRDTIKTNQGCDSVVITILSVREILSEINNQTICLGASYTLPNGSIVQQAGTYRDTIKTNQGCDSVVITILSVPEILSEINNQTICLGASYTLPNGSIVQQAGTYHDTIKTNQGCDSVVITILSVREILSEINNQTICLGASYTLPNGSIVQQAGTYHDTIKTNQGCDSVVITILSVREILSEINNQTICLGASYTLPNGSIVQQAGTYHDTIKTNQGCDSVVITILSVREILSEINNQTICLGASYTLPNGSIVQQAGTYRDTIKTNQGCDSVVITILSVREILSEINNQTICLGASYTLPNGSIVQQAGTYRDTIKTNQGCDSVVITILSVREILSEINNQTICLGASYTLPNGSIVQQAGTYRDTIKTNQGCDSVVITILSVPEILSEINNQTICLGASYTLPNGSIVQQAGTYHDTIKTNQGCDSVVITILSVREILSEINNQTICLGASYTLPNGSIVQQAGTYRDTIKTNQGCDSVVITILSVREILSEINNQTICLGASYTLPNGSIVQQAGTYRDTIKTNQGCDSVVITILSVREILSEINNQTICLGASYTLPNGSIVQQAGTYRDTIKTNQGCDSVVITILSVPEILSGKKYDEFCEGSPYKLPSGKIVINEGIYNDTIKTNKGCDSVITLSLKMNQNKQTILYDTACKNDNYNFYGQIINTSGKYKHTLNTSKNCDSIIELNIHIYQNPNILATSSQSKAYKNDSVHLNISSDQDLFNIIWQPSEILNNATIQNPIAIIVDSITFLVVAENNVGCISSSNVFINLNTEDCVTLPNTFTPNGNNINDVFKPLGKNIKSIIIFRIFDRWGNLIFESNDINSGWDGTYKGKLLEPNVFIYYIETICKDDTKSFKKGNVTLLR
jgi:gliding motility-associated-like protein